MWLYFSYSRNQRGDRIKPWVWGRDKWGGGGNEQKRDWLCGDVVWLWMDPCHIEEIGNNIQLPSFCWALYVVCCFSFRSTSSTSLTVWCKIYHWARKNNKVNVRLSGIVLLFNVETLVFILDLLSTKNKSFSKYRWKCIVSVQDMLF